MEATRGSDTHHLLEIALTSKRHVATTNKGLIRQYGPGTWRSWPSHTESDSHTTTRSLPGWPLMYAVERPLAHLQIHSIQAVLSSTCNMILEKMEQGFSFSAALNHARALGISEPDPELDLSGWDTAQKLLILCARAQRQALRHREIWSCAASMALIRCSSAKRLPWPEDQAGRPFAGAADKPFGAFCRLRFRRKAISAACAPITT